MSVPDAQANRSLSEPVRQRVVAVAADTLGTMPADDVPLPLRSVARFAPQKRARLGATPIAVALERDPAFRQRVAERLRVDAPELVAAVEEGVPLPVADPVEIAAAAYILRPAGWEERFAAAERELVRAAEHADTTRAGEVVARLTEELEAARRTAAEEAERLRGELEAAKAEVASLRRKVAEAREGMRRAAEGGRQAEEAAAQARAGAPRGRVAA